MSILISMPSFIKYYYVNELGKFHFFCEFGPRQSLDRPMVNGIWQSLGLDLVYINLYAFVIKILRTIKEFGPGSFFRSLASAKPRLIIIDSPQYLGLELVNINAYEFFFVSKYSTPRDRASLFYLFFFFFFWIYRPSANGKRHLTIPLTRYHQHQCVCICF